MQQISRLTQEHQYLTPHLSKEYGVSKYKFYKFVKENNFEQVSRGIYAPKDEWIDELYLLHQRCPQAVFSHDEAFYYHGLSDREPVLHTMTIYSGYNAHRLKKDGSCKIYTVKKGLLPIGKVTVTSESGHKIPMYDLERTICDMFRSRKSLEIQDFSTILKSYVARKDKNFHRLMQYAKPFHLENVIRNYMEVLL